MTTCKAHTKLATIIVFGISKVLEEIYHAPHLLYIALVKSINEDLETPFTQLPRRN